jgi:hypothetical protein
MSEKPCFITCICKGYRSGFATSITVKDSDVETVKRALQIAKKYSLIAYSIKLEVIFEPSIITQN